MWRCDRQAALRAFPVLVLCLAANAHSACDSLRGAGTRAWLDELSRLEVPRAFAPRLSVSSPYRPCTRSVPPGATIPRTACGAPGTPSPEFRAFNGRVTAAGAGSTNPQTLQAAALAELLYVQSAGEGLRRAVEGLGTASRLARNPAPALADLAATYLVRAGYTQDAADLFAAADVATRAVELDPRNQAALYNRALALDWLGVDGEAMPAWAEYLAEDSTSGWADEARERIRALESAAGPPSFTDADTSTADIAAFAARSPQEARLAGWDRLLDEWGEAVRRGDAARAADRLRLAGALGDALARQDGDRTLADAVAAIRAAAPSRAKTRTLARAHQDYAAGQRAYLALDHDTAEAAFAKVLGARPASVTLEQWTKVFRAANLYYLKQQDTAERIIRAVLPEVDAARHPALAGRARWHLGTILLRTGYSDPARSEYRQAARLFETIGEREHLGAVQYGAAEAEFVLGDEVAAHALMHRGLMNLRPYRTSRWLHNLLLVTANAATAAGFTRAAAVMRDEDMRVARSVGVRLYEVEAHLARARLLAESGQTNRAVAAADSAQALIPAIRSTDARDWFEQDLRFTRAVISFAAEPGKAVRELDSVVKLFTERNNPLRLIPALVMRSEARLALGDAVGAAADLDSVTARLGRLNRAILNAALRASMMEPVEELFDRLTMLHVSAGRGRAALDVLERGRTSFAPARSRREEPDTARPAIPAGRVAVEYALIGDTLLIGTRAGTTPHLVRVPVDAKELLLTIERAWQTLEGGDPAEDAPHADLARLYDLLIRPVRARLDSGLVLIADGEIAAAPFSALYDAEREQYLVENHTIRFAGSLRDAGRVERRGGASAGEVLLVADPAFSSDEFPDLGRLEGARAEVDSIAAKYGDTVVLDSARATPAALLAALRRARVFHYAGHALFDEARPDRSSLVLAPPGDGGPGRLTAAALGTLNLPDLQLVVLSACQTLRSREGRSGGFAGFSGALLGAGAGGVVGSLWQVDDRLTLPLMVAFHRAWRESGDGAEALRAAQLEMLRSRDRRHRSPVAWAAFRYAGR